MLRVVNNSEAIGFHLRGHFDSTLHLGRCVFELSATRTILTAPPPYTHLSVNRVCNEACSKHSMWIYSPLNKVLPQRVIVILRCELCFMTPVKLSHAEHVTLKAKYIYHEVFIMK